MEGLLFFPLRVVVTVVDFIVIIVVVAAVGAAAVAAAAASAVSSYLTRPETCRASEIILLSPSGVMWCPAGLSSRVPFCVSVQWSIVGCIPVLSFVVGLACPLEGSGVLVGCLCV